MDQLAQSNDLRILVLDSRATVVTDTLGLLEGTTISNAEVLTTLRTNEQVSVIQPDGINRYTLQPVNNPDGDIVALVFLISSVQDINELVAAVSTQTDFLNLLTASFATIAAIIVSIIILSPLKRLLRVVERMRDGHFNQRVEIIGNDEFSELCKGFNEMSDKLESIEQTREEFVSNVSHELKTPLSSIKVLSESILLQESVQEEMYREFLQDITSEVNRMDHIINDLLTLVKLDQTTTFINISDVDIVSLIKAIVKRLTPLAGVKEISIVYDPSKEISIQGDETKLTLALSNLIENGIKYTPNGGTVTVISDSDHQNVFITVKDTGMGIAEEELSKIFTRFYRVDKTRDRDTGGTGLGLSITHTTILLHKGSIRVSSKENEGTTFIVRLPILHQYQSN